MSQISQISNSIKTPYLEVDLSKVRQAYSRLSENLKGIDIHYAMKCNPDPLIMKTVLDCGGQFEISSAVEFNNAVTAGALPENILFSNPVKRIDDIRIAYEGGLKYFSFDSVCEIEKLAKAAPDASVYVRISVPTGQSAVASEGKFGIPNDQARILMNLAKSKGLKPYGISLHVGSQMLDHNAWAIAIKYGSGLIADLKTDGIELQMLDLGGGFPVLYGDVDRDNLDKAGEEIRKALDLYIPKNYRIVAEPGRYLVAEAGTMVSSVIGIAERFGKKWLHLDIGASNGLMEALQTANKLAFPISDSKNSEDKSDYVLTGPTCDSQDTILFHSLVSSDIELDDKVIFAYAGAYSTAFNENFNGFAEPTIEIVGDEK